MKALLATSLKLIWGGYWIITSLYCLLCFLPYTYCAFIMAPPYAWMPWFVHHHPLLYWVALGAAILGFRPRKTDTALWVAFAAEIGLGVYLSFHPVLAGLQNSFGAYVWGMICLVQVAVVAFLGVRPGELWQAVDREPVLLLPYAPGVFAAIGTSLLCSLSARLPRGGAARSSGNAMAELELTVWSILCHVALCLALVALLNVTRMIVRRVAGRRERAARLLTVSALPGLAIGFGALRFFNTALSFEGRPAWGYACLFALALTLLGISVVLPCESLWTHPARRSARGKGAAVAVLCVCGVLAVASPSLVAGGDWNGLIQSVVTMVLWTVLGVSAYWVFWRRATYSVATAIGVPLLTLLVYQGLVASQILWARPLGNTDDEVEFSVTRYSERDASFALVHHVLGRTKATPCGELCRVLREYTNIPNGTVNHDIQLTDSLVPTTGERPNIFILVIDSMRPDYLGAYNPRADFTPNIDQFAKDSVVIHNAYTQYAGTSLSEPAIWSGTMLLHSHFMQPFSRINALEKLAKTDGYQIMVSYDTVLKQVLTPSPDLIKVDTDKPLWNDFELCSTVQETEKALESRPDRSRPVLFYAQPMNLHQFSRNHPPDAKQEGWTSPPGFKAVLALRVRQVDRCLGQFFGYLRKQGLYDNSIIILTSDHGDATGELGRTSHSEWIWPEVIQVPLIVHLPASMREKVVYDDNRTSTLTDIAPSLYYLLGHKPIRRDPVFGMPIFVSGKEELASYTRDEVFLASDVRAVYGILSDKRRYLYVTYDAPAQSYLFDLAQDPLAQHDIADPTMKRQYDQRIIRDLQMVGDYYGYRPGLGGLMIAHH